ncbi:hypothetical protein J3Q64DRAFT_1262291 [Phycomyces blakesleeanus]|uniref:Uncharacterized protein n=2 Tax=Phycomyces blakesleeanus TaxID=4837 RepID=A0ABR3AQT9_PHYBL
MRYILAISAAAALCAQAVIAGSVPNRNFSKFVKREEIASTLSDTFTDFHWSGKDAVVNESYELQLTEPATIQITDFKNRGDVFVVYDNDVVIGETSAIEMDADNEVFAATPLEALEDQRFSQGTFDLAAGDHKITIQAKSPYEAGTAAIRMIGLDNQSLYAKKGGKSGKSMSKGKGKSSSSSSSSSSRGSSSNKNKWSKGGKGSHGDDDEDDEDDEEEHKWHGKGDQDNEWHGKGDQDNEWHGKGDQDNEWNGKGGQDSEWHGKGGQDSEWHGKGGQDDEWHGKGGQDNEWYGNKWQDNKWQDDKWHGDQYPSHNEIDTSHTITITKTNWNTIFQTIVPVSTATVYYGGDDCEEEDENDWHGNKKSYKGEKPPRLY